MNTQLVNVDANLTLYHDLDRFAVEGQSRELIPHCSTESWHEPEDQLKQSTTHSVPGGDVRDLFLNCGTTNTNSTLRLFLTNFRGSQNQIWTLRQTHGICQGRTQLNRRPLSGTIEL